MKSKFKYLALIVLVSICVAIFAIPAQANQLFTDLSPEHWCYNKIIDFEKKGYVCGYEDDTFRPDRTITRAEYVKIVNNFFGYELETKKDAGFSDVSSGDWFAPYVNEAVERGYITGYEDGTFKPQEPIRRQEATVILSRILGIDDEEYPANHQDGLAQYSDGDEVQEWAKVAIHSYSVYNFINGYEDGTLRILRNVTRAETVELLHVLEQKIVIDRPTGSTKTVKIPTITLWKEITSGEEVNYTCAELTEAGWINKSESTLVNGETGVLVNITTTTSNAKIFETLDTRTEVREYITTETNDLTNRLFLTDGVYNISAYATKSGYRKSSSGEKEVKVDTTSPIVNGVVKETSTGTQIAHEQAISLTIFDPKYEGVNAISDLNKEKIRYAWFKETIDNEEIKYEKVGEWIVLELDENGQALVTAPTEYGSYKLGVSAFDYAENSFGNLTDTVKITIGDNSGETEEIPFDFVEELDKEDDETKEDIIVIVGNNAPIVDDLTLYTKVNESVSGEIKATDPDSGDVLTYELSEDAILGASLIENVTEFVSSEAGVYEYFVTVKDNYSGEAVVKVTVYVYDIEIEIPEEPEQPENPDEPTNPDVDSDKLVVFVGEEESMEAIVTPSGEHIKDIVYDWSFSGDDEKAEISGDNDKEEVSIVGKEPGETTVKLETEITVSGDEKVIIEKEITIVVLSRITVTLPSASKEYDGIPLTAHSAKTEKGLSIEGVVADGDIVDVDVSGEIVYSGETSAEAIEDSFNVKSVENEDVTKYYVPTFVSGILKITSNTKLITIESVSGESWVYDGETHSVESYIVTYSGEEVISDDTGKIFTLPTGDKITISNPASVKDVDDSAENNNTFEYAIENKEQYSNINVTFGTIKITKRNVTLESATDSKVYDGVALTNSEVLVKGDGFVSGEGATYNVTGSIIDVGSGENEFTYDLTTITKASNYEITTVNGILTVTALEDKVTVTITEHSGEAKYDGAKKEVTGYDVEISNPLYKEVDFAFSGTAKVEGTDAGSYDMELKASDFTNINNNFANVEFVIVDGALEIAKRNVTLTSSSDSKVYDGTALENDEVTISGDGFVRRDGVTFDVTGNQINVGSSENEFTYELKSGTKASNYEITTVKGTLTVTALEDKVTVTITEHSKEEKYDGTKKEVTGYDVEISNPLYKEADFTFTGTAKAEGTDAGSYEMELKASDFTNTNKNFANVEFVIVDGTLKIAKRNVTLTSSSDSKVYDGTALENDEVIITGDGFVSGEGVTYNVAGSQTEIGSSKNTFTYELKSGTKASNYEITTVNGTLTVTALKDKVTVTITEHSKEEKYDGTKKEVTGYDVEISNPLYKEADFTFNGTAKVEGTDAGSYKMNLRASDFTNTNKNFANVEFVIVDGTLEITKRNVTLTSETASKTYDGTILMRSEVVITGDGFVSGDATVKAIGEITYCGTTTNTIEIEWNGKASNYNVSKVEGTLEITSIEDEIIITAGSESKIYDGTALTCDEYTFTEGVLLSGDVLEVVIRGSQTEVGSSENVVASYKVMNGTKDVTNCYTFGQVVNGTLPVKAQNILYATISYEFEPKNDGWKAEPGDDISYEITLEESGDDEPLTYPRTVIVHLDSDVGEPTALPSNAVYNEDDHTIVWTIDSDSDALTYTVTVKESTAAGSKVITTVNGATANSSRVDIEENGYVKRDIDKNIVLVLDVSYSMDWSIGNSKTKRIEALRKAAKSFTSSVISAQGNEDITITIVEFYNSANVVGSTMTNPTSGEVGGVIDTLKTKPSTNYNAAIQKATEVLGSASMIDDAQDFVIFISDGDPTTEVTKNTLNSFKRMNANTFAIGIGNNYTKWYLTQITGDESKVFDAAEEDDLIAAFDAIFKAMFAAQSDEGILTATAGSGELIYPIKLAYIDTSDTKVTVTVSDSGDLATNNLAIVGNEVRWNISRYPGCTEFELEINRTIPEPVMLLDLFEDEFIYEEEKKEDEIVE